MHNLCDFPQTLYQFFPLLLLLAAPRKSYPASNVECHGPLLQCTGKSVPVSSDHLSKSGSVDLVSLFAYDWFLVLSICWTVAS